MPPVPRPARLRARAAAFAAAAACGGADRGVGTEPVPDGAAPPATARTCAGVGGSARSQAVAVPQRGGGALEAQLFAPDAALQAGPCPLVVVLPGAAPGSRAWRGRPSGS